MNGARPRVQLRVRKMLKKEVMGMKVTMEMLIWILSSLKELTSLSIGHPSLKYSQLGSVAGLL